MWRSFSTFLLLLMALNAGAASGFSVQDMAGRQHRLADYKGKWVIVNYWATWCPPCLEEVPDLVNLYDQRKDRDVMVLGIAFEYKTRAEVEKFVDDMLMAYPIVLGDERVAAQIGSAAVLPTTYIFNPQGRLVKTRRGLVTKAYLESVIEGRD
ncbi:glutathione peroxidase [Methylophilaceae bacterium]|nr:glutathione peroxidase [Methylophilaceae bacterium]